MKKTLLLFTLLSTLALANQAVVDKLFAKYTKNGGSHFSATKGKQMWEKTHMVKGEKMSCTKCHTANLTVKGEHYKTGKVIEPLAPSVNPKSFETVKHAKKWFKRNCKQVYKRKCTAQEKGDFLSYIVSQ